MASHAHVWDYNYHTYLQNEIVNRPFTSQRKVADLRRPDQRTAMKVRVEKTYNFVGMLWASYVASNRVDLR